MNPKIIARTAAVVVLAGAVLACALEWAQRNRTPAPPTATAHDNTDPLADELSRCKALGAEAANDAACKAGHRTVPGSLRGRPRTRTAQSSYFPRHQICRKEYQRFIGTNCRQPRNPMAAD